MKPKETTTTLCRGLCVCVCSTSDIHFRPASTELRNHSHKYSGLTPQRCHSSRIYSSYLFVITSVRSFVRYLSPRCSCGRAKILDDEFFFGNLLQMYDFRRVIENAGGNVHFRPRCVSGRSSDLRIA